MAFTYVADGIDDVLAAHLNQYADAWSGVAGKGQPFNAVAVNDPINFAISARNLDPTNSRAAQYLKADGTVLFQCDASGVKVSPDGNVASVPVTVTSTQTLTNKTFTSPHMTGPVVDSGGLTVTLGGLTITGDSTLTGALSGLTTLTATVGAFGGGVPASAGAVRIPNNTFVAFRNNGNTNNISMGVDTLDRMVFGGGNVLAIATTVGAAGAAAALPANPLGYWRVALNGSEVKIPYYNP